MTNFIKGSVLFLTFLLLSTKVASANVVINEFSSDTSPDWVEIYNSGPDPVDLSLYRLRDNSPSGNEKDLTGQLPALGFASFDWGISLNKAGDIISLVKISDSSLADKVAYGDQGTDVVAPEPGQTAGRQVDGGSSWVIFSSATQNATNNTATPVPTATFTPTPFQTPTPTLTPTKTPTPINSPTPTRTPTPTKVPTPTKIPTSPTSTTDKNLSSKQISPTTAVLIRSSSKKSGDKNPAPTAVLGESTEAKQPTISEEIKSSTPSASLFLANPLASILIGAGSIILVSCGILAFYFYKKNRGEGVT